MSQSQVAYFTKGLPDTSGWRDIDFYRIKLVVDRVDGIGFRHYLKHWKQAWRDLKLWIKFDKLAREKPKDKERANTFFKRKKKIKDPKQENKKEEVKEVEKRIDEKDKKE